MWFFTKSVVDVTFLLCTLSGVHIFSTAGKGSEMKIYNANSAVGNRYLKHAVMVRTAKNACGGAILTPKAILTAAHCVTKYGGNPPIQEDVSEINVCAGTALTDCESPWAQKRWVQNIFAHKEFTIERQGHDIAILVLWKALVEDGKTVERVGLPTRRTTVGTVGTLIGWGHTKCVSSDTQYVKEAQYTTLTIMSETSCVQNFPISLETGELCAVDMSNTSLPCSGDSGSPLICDGKLIGITSMSWRYPIPAVPSTYTDVFYYRNWINGIIKRENNFLKGIGARVRDAGLLIIFLLSLIFIITPKRFL